MAARVRCTIYRKTKVAEYKRTILLTIKATLKTWGGLERKSWEKKTAKEKANNNVNKQTNKHKYFLKIPMCTFSIHLRAHGRWTTKAVFYTFFFGQYKTDLDC